MSMLMTLTVSDFVCVLQGVKPVKPALPTVPMSPAFALKHRVRLPVEVPEEKVNGKELSLRVEPKTTLGKDL